MITYVFSNNKKPLYEQLAGFIQRDIENGTLAAHEKLPSKRSLAKHLGVSVITVETAYGQLVGEGYLYALEKRGYFVTDIREYLPEGSAGGGGRFLSDPGDKDRTAVVDLSQDPAPGRAKGGDLAEPQARWDLSGNQVSPDRFPFSVWTRLLRRCIAEDRTALLTPSWPTGVEKLRLAIAAHLSSFRGMRVDPEEIVVGAGTEYLYGLILQLIGRDKVYCLENPGYKKAAQIYEMNGAVCRFAGMDRDGIRPEELTEAGADVAHISPNHHFPTGIIMPVKRRLEILQWAEEEEGRYIIEDDYDSEFRFSGKPLPPLFSADRREKVIYTNTFSKSLSPTIRVSYMVLPPHLAAAFREKLFFYSCTVPNFVQYTLAAFLSEGYFEKHINRMRHYYAGKRQEVLGILSDSGLGELCRVQEEMSGLHFTLQFRTELSDAALVEKLKRRGIRMTPLSAYDHLDSAANTHTFILNYTHLDTEDLSACFGEIRRVLEEEA